MSGLIYALPLAIGLWSLIIVFGAGLGWIVDQIVDDLVIGVHAKIFLAVILIFVGLFALEALLKQVFGSRP